MCLFFVSLSSPEFHSDHRRISLQAARSHQLPSATFCHTLSEGRGISVHIYNKKVARLFVWSMKSGKHLAGTDSRCAYLCSRYLSLLLLFFSFLSFLSLSSFLHFYPVFHPSLTCLFLASYSLSLLLTRSLQGFLLFFCSVCLYSAKCWHKAEFFSYKSVWMERICCFLKINTVNILKQNDCGFIPKDNVSVYVLLIFILVFGLFLSLFPLFPLSCISTINMVCY